MFSGKTPFPALSKISSPKKIQGRSSEERKEIILFHLSKAKDFKEETWRNLRKKGWKKNKIKPPGEEPFPSRISPKKWTRQNKTRQEGGIRPLPRACLLSMPLSGGTGLKGEKRKGTCRRKEEKFLSPRRNRRKLG